MRFQRSVPWAGVAVLLLSACTQSPQAKEAKYLEKGKKEFDRKNYAVAVLHFKTAAAASYFHKATELNPKHTLAQVKLAELMSSSRRKEDVEEAQKRSSDVLAILPDDVDALNVLAVAELRLGKPESAEAHLEQALRKSPSNLKSSVALAQTRLCQQPEILGCPGTDET